MKVLFRRILRVLARAYILWRYEYSCRAEVLEGIGEPFVLVANHVNNADPLFVSLPVKGDISFVANERFFHEPLAGYFLRLFEAVPKVKFRSDLVTIRQLTRMKAKGNHIGIFPEGQRSWDGVTGPLIFSTAKLIRLLKMPLVGARIQGGALAEPRWSDHLRRGRVHIDYQLIMTREEILASSDEEIYKKMIVALDHDEMAAQAQDPHPYEGGNLARGLEKMLYFCPRCEAMDTLRSDKDDLTCTRCGYRVTYGVYGEFSTRGEDPLYFANTRDWDRGQERYLRAHLAALEKTSFSKEALVVTLKDKRAVKTSKELLLRLTSGEIHLPEGHRVSTLSGINIQSNDLLEFYTDDDTLIQVRFKNPAESVYKWQQALIFLKEGE